MPLYYTKLHQSIYQPLPKHLCFEEKTVLHARLDPCMFLDFAPFPSLVFRILNDVYTVQTVVYDHLNEHSSGCDKRFELRMKPQVHLPNDIRNKIDASEESLISRFRQDLSAKFDIVQPSEATLSKSRTLRTNGDKVEFKDGIITGLGIWVRKEPLAAVLDDEVAVELRLAMEDY